MAHMNDVFLDVNHPILPEELRNYEQSSDSRCSCCPYGFHVDNSFINFTDSMKRGKTSRSHTVHGNRPVHLHANQPDLILNHGESSSITELESDRDNFALFGTRTERRKRKMGKRDKSIERERVGQREYLDISRPTEPFSDSVFTLEALDKQMSKNEHFSTGSIMRSDEIAHGVHSCSTDSSICKHCPVCLSDEASRYACPHHQLCCHNNSTCIDCCSDVCYHEDYHCDDFHHMNKREVEDLPKLQPVEQTKLEIPIASLEEPIETIKIEFDPEKVNEIRQYLIKCVNRIHELEAQLRSMPVMQVRNSALREENSLLQDRVANQKMIIEQLNRDIKEKLKPKQDMLKLYNIAIQTDSIEPVVPVKAHEIAKPQKIDRGLDPIIKQPRLTTKSAQTIQEPHEIKEEIRESRAKRNLASPISRRKFNNLEESSQKSVSETKSVGVGDHGIVEFYTLDPSGWKMQDIPESLYKHLRRSWVASLPKPRVVSAGVNNVPDYRHKLVDASEEVRNASAGDHDVNHLYFLQPEHASEQELPTSFVQSLRKTLENDYRPKVSMASIGVSAVEPTRSQMVETEHFTDTFGVGNHDISSLYFIQPHLLRLEELPSDAVGQMYNEWESRLPKKPKTITSGIQCDVETCEQALETDGPPLSSIGVGEHDVSRFYLLEYQLYDCEGELPPEILMYLKEKWRRNWEQSLPAKPLLTSSSTMYSRAMINQNLATDGLVRRCSIGIGDHDVSKIYFLQSNIDSIDNELPSQYLQRLSDILKDSWLRTLPSKPELVNRVVEYRRNCHEKSSATERQVRRSIGFGDHNVEKLYFLDTSNSSAHDLPSDFVNKLKLQWKISQDNQKPVRPRLISRAVMCAPDLPIQLDVGTMSEDPQPAMFDESVDVDLDDEEWAALDEKTWSDGSPLSKVGGTNFKAFIEKLRRSYRYRKPEFVSVLSKVLDRQVRAKSVQVSPELTDSCTIYGDLSSSLITRGVGEDTTDTQLVSPIEKVSFGTQHKPFGMNKFSSTDAPVPVSKWTNTERRLHDQAVTYNRQTKSNSRGVNTDKSKTRSVVVWADLDRQVDERPYDSDEDHFIKETWEELSIYDSQGNVIRTERLPTYTVATSEKPQIADSMPTREEGGRYEHYYVNLGDSRGSSLAGDHSVGGSSGINIPAFTGPPDNSGTKSRDVTSKPSMDFVPRSPTENHPHVHICGTDPSTSKVNAWQVRGQQFQDWHSTAAGDSLSTQESVESDSIFSAPGSISESYDRRPKVSDSDPSDIVSKSDGGAVKKPNTSKNALGKALPADSEEDRGHTHNSQNAFSVNRRFGNTNTKLGPPKGTVNLQSPIGNRDSGDFGDSHSRYGVRTDGVHSLPSTDPRHNRGLVSENQINAITNNRGQNQHTASNQPISSDNHVSNRDSFESQRVPGARNSDRDSPSLRTLQGTNNLQGILGYRESDHESHEPHTLPDSGNQRGMFGGRDSRRPQQNQPNIPRTRSPNNDAQESRQTRGQQIGDTNTPTNTLGNQRGVFGGRDSRRPQQNQPNIPRTRSPNIDAQESRQTRGQQISDANTPTNAPSNQRGVFGGRDSRRPQQNQPHVLGARSPDIDAQESRQTRDQQISGTNTQTNAPGNQRGVFAGRDSRRPQQNQPHVLGTRSPDIDAQESRQNRGQQISGASTHVNVSGDRRSDSVERHQPHGGRNISSTKRSTHSSSGTHDATGRTVTSIPVNVSVKRGNDDVLNIVKSAEEARVNDATSQPMLTNYATPDEDNEQHNIGENLGFDRFRGDETYAHNSHGIDLSSSLNPVAPTPGTVGHHTFTQKSTRVVSGKTIVTTPSGLAPPGIDHKMPPPPPPIESEELRPLFSTTWSSPEYAGSHTHTTSTVTKSSSTVVAKDGQIIERSTSNDRYTTDNQTLDSQTSEQHIAHDDVYARPKQSFESDDDSVFLKPSPPNSGLHQGLRKSHAQTSAAAVSQDDQCLNYGGGTVESQSFSTPSSPRQPRSIMKRNVNLDSEKQYNTLPLLRKKKGIRFSKDTKSDSVSSSSFSGEDDISYEEELSCESEFMKRLERLREERSIPNKSVIERSSLSPIMCECFTDISDWMQDSSKFSNKQMMESISNLRREWFILSAGRDADSNRVASILETIQQFNPSLLEMTANLVDDNNNTSLHYAVSREQWGIVARLLDTNRIRISKANKAGYTPLMLTALCREVNEAHRPVIQRLLASGNINQGSSLAGQTALMLAAAHGRTDMIHLLLESGADPNRRDKEGSTALMCASEHGHLEAVKMLLTSSNCDPNIKDNDGSTALSIALENKHRDIALMIYSRCNLKDGTTSRSMRKS